MHYARRDMESTTLPQRTRPDVSARALQRIRERWLSNIRHDFSNPLFAARGYIRLALEHQVSLATDSQERYLTAALENLNKLVSLTEELGTFREIDELECESVNLDELIRSTISELSTRLEAKQATLVEEISGAPLSTVGDQRKLSEAVRELLSVAVEFTESGGRLSVRASEENGNIVLETDGTGSPGESRNDAAGRLSNVCRIWRLHAGMCTFGADATGTYRILCELPIVRPQEC